MQHRRRRDSRVLSSASRIARIRRLLICTPTKWPGVGQTSSTHEVWNHGCGFRPRTYQPDCVTQAREIGRLTSENSPALKVDACIRRLRVRGLLACTTTNHPCIIPVGENRVAPKGNVAGSEVGEGRTVAFVTKLGEVVPAAFAAVRPASITTAIGGGVIVSVPPT